MEQLRDCIFKIKQKNLLEKKSVDEYVKFIFDGTKHIDSTLLKRLIIESCHVYKEKDLYDKPVTYLRAIILNKFRERQKQIEKENREFGSLPKIKQPE